MRLDTFAASLQPRIVVVWSQGVVSLRRKSKVPGMASNLRDCQPSWLTGLSIKAKITCRPSL
jgi:hypothetical protein